MIKTRFRKVTYKFDIDIPTSIKHALEIDRINQNNFWRDALELEMMNVGIAFDILYDNDVVPPGWSKVTGHVIFDCKMDMTRKSRWLLDGHKTPEPLHSGLH